MPRYNINQRAPQPSRLDRLTQLQALDTAGGGAGDGVNGVAGLLSQINEASKGLLLPGQMEAQQLSNEAQRLQNRNAEFDYQWRQPQTEQAYNAKDLANQILAQQNAWYDTNQQQQYGLNAAQLARAPEDLRGARLTNDRTEASTPAYLKGLDITNQLGEAQVARSPEELRRLQLGNQQTELSMPEIIRQLQLGNDQQAFQNAWSQPFAEQKFGLNQGAIDALPEQLRGMQLGNEKLAFENQWAQPNAELQNRLGNAQVGLAEARAKNYMANAGIDPQVIPYLVQMGIMTPEEAASLVLTPEQLQARRNPPTQPMPPGAVAEDVLANAYGVGPDAYPETYAEWLGQDVSQGLKWFLKTINPFTYVNKKINY